MIKSESDIFKRAFLTHMSVAHWLLYCTHQAMCSFLDSRTPETPKTVVLGFLGLPRLPISQILGVLGVLESRLPRLPLPSKWGFWESRESGLRDSQYSQNLGYWESRDSQESQNHGLGVSGVPESKKLHIAWCVQYKSHWATGICVKKASFKNFTFTFNY